MIFNWTKNSEEEQKKIDIREVFNIWDILKSKYDTIEKIGMWHQFAHDKDLKYILNKLKQEFKYNIQILEKILNKYSVRGPEQGRLSSNWSGNSEPFRDEIIALNILYYMQEHVENMMLCSRTSITNDKLRKKINKMLFKTIDEVNILYKYLKFKGWIDNPPLYPNTPTNNNEKISCAEASHLWDHLTYRYDNIRETNAFLNLAHDKDFYLLIKRGLKILENQINVLETECKKFGITMPKKPAKIFNVPENTELYNDDQIYRLILIGQQNSAIVHVKAIKQCAFNDRIRNIFVDMLVNEIKYFEKFIRYGKVKEWLNSVPKYKV